MSPEIVILLTLGFASVAFSVGTLVLHLMLTDETDGPKVLSGLFALATGLLFAGAVVEIHTQIQNNGHEAKCVLERAP